MSLSWWDIPGPSRYVQRVENSLYERLNVVAALPDGYGKKWFTYFQKRWRNKQEQMDVISVTNNNNSPISVLCETLTASPLKKMTIKALARESGFKGRTLGIYIDRSGPVKEWMDFLESYELECRSTSPLDRTVFLIVTEGVAPKRLPKEETNRRVYLYDGFALPRDCHMYSWVLIGSYDKQTWRTELKMALIAQLAQWDPYLCEYLSDRDLKTILHKESLNSYDMRDKMNPSQGDLDDGWASGILQRCNGEVVYHSKWLAEYTSTNEYEQRIWAAQLQVIFPLIEQIRRKAIEKYRDRLTSLSREKDGVIVNEPYDLEIKEIRRLISYAENVPKAFVTRIEQAYKFRNTLAHLDLLTDDDLQQFEPILEL